MKLSQLNAFNWLKPRHKGAGCIPAVIWIREEMVNLDSFFATFIM
jgi:hypothetical protein